MKPPTVYSFYLHCLHLHLFKFEVNKKIIERACFPLTLGQKSCLSLLNVPMNLVWCALKFAWFLTLWNRSREGLLEESATCEDCDQVLSLVESGIDGEIIFRRCCMEMYEPSGWFEAVEL